MPPPPPSKKFCEEDCMWSVAITGFRAARKQFSVTQVSQSEECLKSDSQSVSRSQ